MEVDTTFDFRRDADGKDPDGHSSTLRRYHRLLWSKRLPDGTLLDLSDRVPGVYLHHKSRRGEFFLSSDTVVPTFRKNPRIIAMLEDLGKTPVNAFGGLGYTIGGMMLFPGNRIGGKQTINQRRGCHPRIKDRFDLTLECIRCHYCEKYSPLAETLARYSSFFDLFEDFRGYVEYFLLEDLVERDFTGVRFHLPFSGFGGSPLPRSSDEYEGYRTSAIAFIEARNRRIAAWCEAKLAQEKSPASGPS